MPAVEKESWASGFETNAKVLRDVATPGGGWLRTIRESLGWPRRVVAERLGVSPAAVRDYERGETDDTISLATLRRTARAMGCDVVVALVPSDDRSYFELASHAVDRANRRRRIASPHAGPPHQRTATSRPDDTAELESHLK